MADTWEWDGSTWREMLPETSPPARFGSTLTFDENRGTLVLIGGVSLQSTAALGDMWEWTGRTWRPITPAGVAPQPRFFQAACFDARLRRLVLHGGFTARGVLGFVNPLSDTWSWDGSAWIQAASFMGPAGRGQHGIGFDPGCGRVIMFGGHNGQTSYPPETWSWDGVTWTQLPNSATTPPTLVDPHFIKHPLVS